MCDRKRERYALGTIFLLLLVNPVVATGPQKNVVKFYDGPQLPPNEETILQTKNQNWKPLARKLQPIVPLAIEKIDGLDYTSRYSGKKLPKAYGLAPGSHDIEGGCVGEDGNMRKFFVSYNAVACRKYCIQPSTEGQGSETIGKSTVRTFSLSVVLVDETTNEIVAQARLEPYNNQIK